MADDDECDLVEKREITRALCQGQIELSSEQKDILRHAFDLENGADDALHRAVWKNDLMLVMWLLTQKRYRDSINVRDKRGNPPLHIAAHFANKRMVKALLDHGAIPTAKNAGGWTSFQEAVATGSFHTSVDLYIATQHRIASEFRIRSLRMAASLSTIGDFYMELKWSFQSWIPLVSRFCPNDTYKVWKRGSSIRVDSTLIGFDNMTWHRGNVTFLFTGGESDTPGELLILNHDKKTLFAMKDSLKLHPRTVEKDVRMVMRSPLLKTRVDSKRIAFKPRLTWFGYEKEEAVGGWSAKVFDAESIVVRTRARSDEEAGKKKLRQNKIFHEEKYLAYEEYFDAKADPLEGMVWFSENVEDKVREFRGTVWLSRDFPMNISDLLPIVEMLAPSGQHFKKLKDFLHLQMPDAGFPVKIDVPLFPTVTATASFDVFEGWKDEDDEKGLFVIPAYEKETDKERKERERGGDGKGKEEEE